MQNFFIVCECYDVPPVLSSINSLKYYIILTQKIKIKCQLHGHLYQWIMKNCTIAKIWAISCINATHLVNTSVKKGNSKICKTAVQIGKCLQQERRKIIFLLFIVYKSYIYTKYYICQPLIK